MAVIANKFFISLYLSSKINNNTSMINCAKYIIQLLHIKSFIQIASNIIDRTLIYITATKNGTAAHFRVKVACCELLFIIAK